MAGKYSSFGYGFNSRKLGQSTIESIATNAVDQANQAMMPQNGGIGIIFDGVNGDWTAWYWRGNNSISHAIGFHGRGKRALDAIKDLEAANKPHPDLVEQQLINSKPC